MGARCGNHEHVPGQWWTTCNHEFRLEPDVCLFQPPCPITSAIANRSRVFSLRPWVHVGPGCARLGLSSPCRPSWAHVGPMLALCLCWPMLALSWPMLALSWPYVGPMLAYVGPMLAHLGAYVEAMCDMWDHLLKDLQDAKFSFQDPRRTKNNVKTTGFYFREQKTCARPSAQNTVKHDVFVTSHTGNTVNYGGRFPCLLHALSFVLSVSVMAPKSCKEVPKTRDAAYLRTAKGRRGAFNGKLLRNVAFWPVENFSEGSRHGSKEPQRSVENPGCCLPWNYH